MSAFRRSKRCLKECSQVPFGAIGLSVRYLMGCGNSAAVSPAPTRQPPFELELSAPIPQKAIEPTEESDPNPTRDMGQPLFELPSVSVSSQLLTSPSFLQSSFLNIDGQIMDSASFFNPFNKPTIFEYQFEQHLGHGSASDVFLVYNTENNMYYAAKVYDQAYLYRTSIGDAEQPAQKVAREILIMSECHHPNVLPLIELLDDEPTHSLILIIPYAQKGGLSKSSWKANPMGEDEAKNVFRQIAEGLQYLHENNIIHRDIKPENVLVFGDGHVCIADFSVSSKLEDPDIYLEDTEGTPVFYSPEQCTGEPYKGKPADCWAFGIMLYVMIYGKLPFFEADDEKVFGAHFFKIAQVISTGELTYPDTTPISPELADLFSHVLDRNPEDRYTMDQIVAHPWFAFS